MAEALVRKLNRSSTEELCRHLGRDLSTFLASRELTLEFHSPSTISARDLDQCFCLVRDNLKSCYENSSWGWDPEQKRAELEEPDTRYLLVHHAPGSSLALHGFLSFQIVVEENVPVVYCYELQIAPALRGRGIGRDLMHAMHEIARTNDVELAMLTVFTANELAVRFYKQRGYQVDKSSPKPKVLRGRQVKADYVILSNSLSHGEALQCS